MKKNQGLLGELREDIDKASSIKVNINVDIDQSILGVVIQTKGNIIMDIDLDNDMGRLDISNLSLEFDYAGQDLVYNDEIKSWHNMATSVSHITNLMSAFISPYEGIFINFDTMMPIESDNNSRYCQTYTLTEESGNIIPGYKDSLLVLCKLENYVYELNFILVTEKTEDYYEQFVNSIDCKLIIKE